MLQDVGLHPLHVRGAQTFGGALYFILYVFSITETVIPVETRNVVAMYENVFAAVCWFNEAEAFVGVEPFDFTVCHCLYLVFRYCTRIIKTDQKNLEEPNGGR